ncbi:MaoC family dehydratase [Pikeienuella sp. HZG-20]|uniref:MaoC family dehydratase n=1 Tax=Paludibacillus litoralis TaxID=3133267 RepID=UPI0030EEBCEC
MPDFPESIAPMTIQTSHAAAEGYAALTKDWNPIHLDPDFAARTPFGRPIAHGTMALNLLVEAVGRASGGALRVADLDIRFVSPTFVGESLTADGTRDGREGAYEVRVTAGEGRIVLQGRATLAPKTRAGGAECR